jgi:hypothetical protein
LTHGFSSFTPQLVNAGLSTVDDLLCILEAEWTTYKAAVRGLVKQGRIDEQKAEWTIEALGEARRDLKVQ